MATRTSEGGIFSNEAKSEESTSADFDMQEQSSTMEEETLAETNKKKVPTKENVWKKSEGRKNLMKVVSYIGEKEGGKLSLTDRPSWEQKVDEAYTELILRLQQAWETHVFKIRSQLRKIIAHPWPKGNRNNDPKKILFDVETVVRFTKEDPKRLYLIVFISVSVALLAICLVNSIRIGSLRQDLAVINQEYNFLQEKIGAMMEKIDELHETIRKQNQDYYKEMRKEIRYAFQMSSREARVL